jgi:UDP-N-acetylglucosamine--N-acetylmuramyl-(pentapeptide) pyrophosphoryl-undecaprenol N-acetylglucosamine transferase
MRSDLGIMVTGGGTGGHVYPGIALIDALRELEPGVRLLWVGTRGRVEEWAVPKAGIPIEYVDVTFLKGRSALDRLNALAMLPKAALQARRLLREFSPDAVIGVGGFASGPVGAVAAATGVPTFLLEQNAVPGMTNRTLGPWVDVVYASTEAARSRFRGAIVKVLGNPVRAQLVQHASRRRVGAERRILVVGGSQGARVLNESVPELIRDIQERVPSVTVLHVAGRGNVSEVQESYDRAGVKDAEVVEYVDDMAATYSSIDFVISRAGATTVSELTAIGLPALLVPFARAADDHQTANARAVVEQGGAVMVTEDELGGGRAARILGPLLNAPDVLDKMARASRGVGRPGAAMDIARDILEHVR